MKVKCIALDLDGTTLYDDKHISERTKTAIEKAISAGVHVVVASGRCFDAIPASIKEIHDVEYAITSNGAAIYNMKKNQCVRRYSVPEKAIEKIMELTKPLFCTYEVFYDGRAYAEDKFIDNPCLYGVDEDMAEYIKFTRNKVSDINAFMMEHKNELDSIDLLVEDNNTFIYLLKELKHMSKGIYVTTSVNNRIEISGCEAGKHTGLQFILDHIGVTSSETASFGNADNDIDMIKIYSISKNIRL